MDWSRLGETHVRRKVPENCRFRYNAWLRFCAALSRILPVRAEMLEHAFTEFGYPTVSAEQSLEVQAEHFAIACRIKAVEQELPAFIALDQNVEKPWTRYLAYTLVVLFGAALIYSCVLVPQMEEILAEANRLRYVRT